MVAHVKCNFAHFTFMDEEVEPIFNRLMQKVECSLMLVQEDKVQAQTPDLKQKGRDFLLSLLDTLT